VHFDAVDHILDRYVKMMLKTIKSNLALTLLPILILSSGSVVAEQAPKRSAEPEKSISQSFTLDQAIDYALANNPDMQIAAERISQAEAQLGVALSAFYPQVTARVGYVHSNNPAQVFSMIVSQRDFNNPGSINNINNPGYRQDFRPEIIGKLSLFRGGQDYHNSKAAELGIDAAEFERSTVRNALIESVTASYYAYLAAQEAQKVSKDSIAAITSELKQTRLRYEAGTALKSDVLSLEVKLAEAQETEIRAANGIELSKTGIATLLGLTTDHPFTVASPSLMLPEPKIMASFNDLLELAMTQRPEVKAAATQVEIAQARLKSEQGAYLPKADAYVSYGQDSRTPGFYSSKDNVTAGVSVEMDLFSGLETKNRVSAAERKAAEARETERKTKLAIEQEVKVAFLKLEEALTRMRVTEASVVAADEALRLVNEQRRAETVTVTRYIEAEVARNNAHSNTIAAHYDALSAEAAVKKAVGDWK
jgi:outer membrane protein